MREMRKIDRAGNCSVNLDKPIVRIVEENCAIDNNETATTTEIIEFFHES